MIEKTNSLIVFYVISHSYINFATAFVTLWSLLVIKVVKITLCSRIGYLKLFLLMVSNILHLNTRYLLQSHKVWISSSIILQKLHSLSSGFSPQYLPRPILNLWVLILKEDRDLLSFLSCKISTHGSISNFFFISLYVLNFFIPFSDDNRFFQNEINLSFSLVFIEYRFADEFNVDWLAQTWEKPRLNNMFFTNCNHILISPESFICSWYAFDIKKSLFDWIVCNQKLMQLIRI